MTLYSKWSTGKNIIFIAGVVLLVCICIPWLQIPSQYKAEWSIVKPLLEHWGSSKGLIGMLAGDQLKQIETLHRAFVMSNLRFLALLPMAYPIYSLFTEKFQKKISLISGGVLLLFSLIACIVGFALFNKFLFILYLAAAIAFCVGIYKTEPKGIDAQAPAPDMAFASAPASVGPDATASSSGIYCSTCGAANAADAKFCCKCGKAL